MARGIGKVTFRGFYGDYKIKVFADGKEIGTTFTLKENEKNKIKILGSCGGEDFPAPFCNCEHCETARKMGNKSLRSLHQAIINDDLLIDFPADTNAHCLRFGVRLGNLQNVLITHSHPDHYVPHLGP